jgi:hypothetical protein
MFDEQRLAGARHANDTATVAENVATVAQSSRRRSMRPRWPNRDRRFAHAFPHTG